MTLYPKKATFPFFARPGGYHDQSEAHLFEPFHTSQGVWDWECIVKSVGLVVLSNFLLEGRSNQCRTNQDSGEVLQQSPSADPNRDSVIELALAVCTREPTYAPVIVIWGRVLISVQQMY